MLMGCEVRMKTARELIDTAGAAGESARRAHALCFKGIQEHADFVSRIQAPSPLHAWRQEADDS